MENAPVQTTRASGDAQTTSDDEVRTKTPLEDASKEMFQDPHLAALVAEYKRYRSVIIGLGICALISLISAMVLFKAGIIDGETQIMVIMLCYAFVGLMLLVVFARVRPIKADISTWNSAVEEARSKESKRNNKKRAAVQTEEANDCTRSPKKSKHPDTPEYKSARKKWYALILIATAIMLSAMILIRLDSANFMIAMIVLASSYVFIILAMRIERSTLKPLREQWEASQKRSLRKEAREIAVGQK